MLKTKEISAPKTHNNHAVIKAINWLDEYGHLKCCSAICYY